MINMPVQFATSSYAPAHIVWKICYLKFIKTSCCVLRNPFHVMAYHETS